MGRVDSWRYCPRCATALDHSRARVDCPGCGFRAYSHSEVTVGALLVGGDGRLVLVLRGRDPYAGKWDVPGGFLEEGERPLDGLRRELMEETGLESEPGEFAGAWLDRYGDAPDAPTTLNLYWYARVVGGEARAGDDAAEVQWFPRDQLPPEDEIGFPNVRELLRGWQERTETEAVPD